jgi:hypothetical protein
VEDAVGLRAGTIDIMLDSFAVGAGGFHGIFDEGFVLEADYETGFDFATAAETPGGTMDLLGENLFDGPYGGESVEDFSAEGGVDGFFAGPDEVAGEEAVDDGVFCGGGFPFGGAGSCGGLRVGRVGCDLSCC